MTPIPPPPFSKKGMTVVRGLRPLHVLVVPPWAGPVAEL